MSPLQGRSPLVQVKEPYGNLDMVNYLKAFILHPGVHKVHLPIILASEGLAVYKERKKLEDLKVLRRSPDLLNNVKIGQGQLQLIMEQILFYHIWGLQPFWSSDLNNLLNNPSNSPVISEKKMFRCGSSNEWLWRKGFRSA